MLLSSLWVDFQLQSLCMFITCHLSTYHFLKELERIKLENIICFNRVISFFSPIKWYDNIFIIGAKWTNKWMWSHFVNVNYFIFYFYYNMEISFHLQLLSHCLSVYLAITCACRWHWEGCFEITYYVIFIPSAFVSPKMSRRLSIWSSPYEHLSKPELSCCPCFMFFRAK